MDNHSFERNRPKSPPRYRFGQFDQQLSGALSVGHKSVSAQRQRVWRGPEGFFCGQCRCGRGTARKTSLDDEPVQAVKPLTLVRDDDSHEGTVCGQVSGVSKAIATFHQFTLKSHSRRTVVS